ncbi:hypothetical protein D0Z00_003153 [Geotrichum galactomycetum]|uniref:Uncharacterized protein n=1 Tax=Geotrichum galactomycetum TaxID=27317 RepID=A0ACB6V244_9ASCO|nr:hypothetical protein D0Z00_003153 [Geotrichum candidum]
MSAPLNGTQFSPEVAARLRTYPITSDPSVNASTPLLNDPVTVKPSRIGKPQAIPVPGSKVDGFSEVYRNVHCPDRLITTTHPNITTVVEAFDACVAECKNEKALGERVFDGKTKTWGKTYQYESYGTIAERRLAIGKGISKVIQDVTGLDSRQAPYCLGLYGPNSTNWILTDLAAQTQSIPTVCLYDTLGPDSTRYIITLTEMPAIVCSVAHIPFVLSIKDELPNLKIIIAMNPINNPDISDKPGQSKKDVLTAWAKKSGVELFEFSDVEKIGRESGRDVNLPRPETVLTINFTSGTTGNPKGVVISHANVLAGTVVARSQATFNHRGSTGFLSFLPLAHIYERLTIHSILSAGIPIGFFHGDVTELLDDIATYHPTIVAGVPRVWNRIAGAIRASTIEAPGIAGALSRKAYAAKLARLHESGDYHHPIWDRLWSNKIRSKTGFDQAKAFVTGSAPMARENIELIKVALGVEFVQGYGLTETMGGMSVCSPGDNTAGSVGPVAVTTEVKLRDLPDMNYSSSDKPFPRGEILIRGPQVFMGYYKNEEATKGSIDEDGWFYSGDVGMIDDLGRLYVIDRVKNFFKLAQGEYVGPERIEALYQSSSGLIAQIFVEGNSLETYLVGIVGVNPEAYVQFLSHNFKLHYKPTDIENIKKTFARKDIRDAFLLELNDHAKDAQLKGYEKIKNVTLAIEPFSVENGTLTPTLKVKRPDAAKLFKTDIDAMYKEGPVEAKSKL